MPKNSSSKKNPTVSVLTHAAEAASKSGMTLMEFHVALAKELGCSPASTSISVSKKKPKVTLKELEKIALSEKAARLGLTPKELNLTPAEKKSVKDKFKAGERDLSKITPPRQAPAEESKSDSSADTKKTTKKVKGKEVSEEPSAPNEGTYSTAKTRYKNDARAMRKSFDILEAKQDLISLIRYNNRYATVRRTEELLQSRFPTEFERLKDQLEGYEAPSLEVLNPLLDQLENKVGLKIETDKSVVSGLLTIMFDEDVVAIFNTSDEALKEITPLFFEKLASGEGGLIW